MGDTPGLRLVGFGGSFFMDSLKQTQDLVYVPFCTHWQELLPTDLPSSGCKPGKLGCKPGKKSIAAA